MDETKWETTMALEKGELRGHLHPALEHLYF